MFISLKRSQARLQPSYVLHFGAGTPGQVEQVQVPAAGENDDDVEQFEVDQVMDEGERLLEDRRQRDSEDPTTGYGSTDSRPRPPSMPGRTWPRASEPKDMKVTLVDTVDGSKVAEVNMGLPGDNVMNTPVIYLPTNRKYEFQISTARKTITVFTGQPVPVCKSVKLNVLSHSVGVCFVCVYVCVCVCVCVCTCVCVCVPCVCM